MTFEPGHYYGGGWRHGKRRHPRNDDCRYRILVARQDGFSWREIAWLVGVDHRQVRRYASGERWPSDAVARRIRKRFP